MPRTLTLAAVAGALAIPMIAFADDPTAPPDTTTTTTPPAPTPAPPTPTPPPAPAPADPAPMPEATPPPAPAERVTPPPTPAPVTPAAPSGGLVSQAGVGGPVGYGSRGVLELGGSAGLTIATDMRNINVAPQIGWFVADNLQLSALLNLAYIDLGNGGASTLASALAEPSYHMPFNGHVFGFLGVGVGGSYISDLGGGFAVAPRIGTNVLVGRSGILTPSLSWQYTTHDVDVDAAEGDTAVLAVSSALRVNIGYTVMW